MSIAKTLLLTLLLLLVVAGCGGSPTEPSDYEFGRMDVYVRDTASQPINGVPVRLERTNGQLVEDGVTGNAGAPGYTLFLRTKGDYRISITVPAGYVLADGQSASVPVTFRKDQTDTVNFILRRL
jgi:hypothetical protein